MKKNSFPQPEWNTVTSLEDAFRLVMCTRTEVESVKAQESLLYAVGNNHAGTYFPVVLFILPFIEQVLLDHNVWAKHAVLESLVDLCGSFEPEPGHEFLKSAHGREAESLATLLNQGVGNLLPLIEQLTRTDSITSSAAKQILEIFQTEN